VDLLEVAANDQDQIRVNVVDGLGENQNV
jgi:hypothetical protein